MCMNEKNQLIIFDDQCKFCNGAINFIIKRDLGRAFVFAPLNSALGQAMQCKFNLGSQPDTFALITGEDCCIMSDAALNICKKLSGAWPLMRLFFIVPKTVRDYGYRLFGKYRYRLFGHQTTCVVYDELTKSRFIGDQASF